ncbi:hypothetical protein R1flu_009013 [Riccia fluitans]|uniref:Heme-binding protein 2 n=1 Tax=Riccia fluitans TaxID=41844 RepID=A0ABD1Z0V8_9MARC
MAITSSRSLLVVGLLVLVALVCPSEARKLSPEEKSLLRLVSSGVNEEEQCGPKLSIETPVCSVEKKDEGFELRRYPAGEIWAETLVADTGYTSACAIGFYRCFYFISGQNSAEESIEMTAPVLIKPEPKANGWKISFFTPSKFKSVDDVPVPDSPDVHIVSTKEQLVAVSDTFGGFPTEASYHNEWLKLKAALDKANLKYDESTVVYAGYSSPFEIFNRKQEVHVTIVE